MIGLLMVIGMIPAPLALAGIRRHAPQLLDGRSHAWLMSIEILTFVIISLLFYWAEWPQTGKAILVVLAGLPLFLWYELKRGRGPFAAMRGGGWLILWLVAMTVISWFFGTMLAKIHEPGWDEILVILVAAGFYQWGASGSSLTPQLEKVCVSGISES
jgi:hypothetical protein